MRFARIAVLLMLTGFYPVFAAPLDGGSNTFSKIAIPTDGKIYHGVFPGRTFAAKENPEDGFKLDDLVSYEKTVGKKAAWFYFSNNWFKARAFPMAMCKMIRGLGSVPYIRLMLRSNEIPNQPETAYSLKNIIDGKFDANLKVWALKAKEYGSPIIMEWGTECNDDSRAWNAKWNGNDKNSLPTTTVFGDILLPDGPEEFVAAYRRIVKVIRDDTKVNNITWVFHITAIDNPSTLENSFEAYYPGDDYVDWIGVSAYGSKDPHTTEPTPLADLMNDCYPRIEKMAKGKPVVISELGCTVGKYLTNDKWAEAAFTHLLNRRWPSVIGFSWWNQRWKMENQAEVEQRELDDAQRQADAEAAAAEDPESEEAAEPDMGADPEDDNAEDYTNMRVQHKDNKALLDVIIKFFKDSGDKIQETPILVK